METFFLDVVRTEDESTVSAFERKLFILFKKMSFMFFEAFPTSVRALEVDNFSFFEILGIFFFLKFNFFCNFYDFVVYSKFKFHKTNVSG